jgi:drug/metabolite transporter (DMT)-like permease
MALLAATLFWGCGFAWAKTAGEAINHASSQGDGAAVGPVWVLAMRFAIAGVLWMIVFPDARRGWNWNIAGKSILLGTCLSAGMMVQHLGLDRTSEAVSAFLTSLTILFVPLMLTFVLRRPPAPAAWIGVIVAAAGVWLMTEGSPGGFAVGEMLGLLCAVLYSIDIIAVGALVTPEVAARITAGQFLVVALITATTCMIVPGGAASLEPARIAHWMAWRPVGLNVLLLAVLATMGAFGLQFRFQSHIDPTRAALLYLMEPIFASAFALAARGSRIGGPTMAGAALILIANLLVERLEARRGRGEKAVEANVHPAVMD